MWREWHPVAHVATSAFGHELMSQAHQRSVMDIQCSALAQVCSSSKYRDSGEREREGERERKRKGKGERDQELTGGD